MKTSHPSKTIVQLFIALALVLGAMGSTTNAAMTGTDAKTAFAQLKSLSGDWTGPKMMGHRMNMNIRVIAGGSAVLATFFPGTPMEMISVYYMADGKLVQTHYCMLGNQPRTKLNTKTSSADTLVFDFAGGDNIKTTNAHMHSETIHIVSKDKIENTCTSCEKGKPCQKCTSVLVRK